jgi:hypothetical protein
MQAQLTALKSSKVERVWEFAAPGNKAAVGSLKYFVCLLEVGDRFYEETAEGVLFFL